MSRPLLIVSTSYPETADGSEAAGSFVADFAAAAARHVPVCVIAPGRAAAVAAGVRVVRFSAPRLPLSLLRAYNPLHWPAIATTLRAGAATVDRLARSERPAHILALWALPSGAWARRAWRRHGIAYSVWALGSDIWSLGHLPLVRGVLAGVLREASACFADGHALADSVTALGGRPCAFLPSARELGAPAGKALAVAPPYKLAFLGRWHPNKGVDLLLQALLQLDDAAWQRIAAVRMAGGGPLESQVRGAVAELQRRGRPVELLGFLDRTAAASLLTWADWLAIPSRIESIPVVFSDALQAGCPVVAMPVGDLPRLLRDARLGELAADVSASALAQALRAALLGAAPTQRGAALAAAARDFSVARSAETFLRAAGMLA